MVKHYIEFIPWAVNVNTNAIANSYTVTNILDLKNYLVSIGLDANLGDLVSVYGLNGVAPSAYCQSRMISIRVETNMYIVFSIGCYAYTHNTVTDEDGFVGEVKVNQDGSTSTSSLDTDTVKFNMSIIVDESNTGNGYTYVHRICGWETSSSSGSIMNNQCIRGVTIYSGDTSIVIECNIKYEYSYTYTGTSDHFHSKSFVISKYKYDSVVRYLAGSYNHYHYIGADNTMHGGTSYMYYEPVLDDNQYLIRGEFNGFDNTKLENNAIFKLHFSIDNYYKRKYSTLVKINGDYYITTESLSYGDTYVVKL